MKGYLPLQILSCNLVSCINGGRSAKLETTFWCNDRISPDYVTLAVNIEQCW